MSHWHLTLGETAFFAPAGVIIGAVVSYVAVKKTASVSLEAQRLAIASERDQAVEQRRSDLAREERDHRRAAYGELGGHLQGIFDVLNYIVGPVLQTSTRPESEWVPSAGETGWSGFYIQILDTPPDCRRLAAVYGSPDVRAAVGALGALVRALAPPGPFRDSPGHWIHTMTVRDGGIATELITLSDGNELRNAMLGNIQIVQAITDYGPCQNPSRAAAEQHHSPRPAPWPRRRPEPRGVRRGHTARVGRLVGASTAVPTWITQHPSAAEQLACTAGRVSAKSFRSSSREPGGDDVTRYDRCPLCEV